MSSPPMSAPWSRCRAPPRAPPSPGRTLDAMIDSALAGIENLATLQQRGPGRAVAARADVAITDAKPSKPPAPRQRTQATKS